MRASRVLQKCLSNSLGVIHKARARVLLRAVEALISGRRLTLSRWHDVQKVCSSCRVAPCRLGCLDKPRGAGCGLSGRHPGVQNQQVGPMVSVHNPALH